MIFWMRLLKERTTEEIPSVRPDKVVLTLIRPPPTDDIAELRELDAS